MAERKCLEEQREYFGYAEQFFEKNFGKKNIISAVVYMDEATPHMHLCFVPITEKNRLSSKEIIGGPSGLVKWQDKFYEYMHERYPDIDRETPARLSHGKHIPPFMFRDNPFKIKDDFGMEMLIQSIKDNGVLVPIVNTRL